MGGCNVGGSATCVTLQADAPDVGDCRGEITTARGRHRHVDCCESGLSLRENWRIGNRQLINFTCESNNTDGDTTPAIVAESGGAG